MDLRELPLDRFLNHVEAWIWARLREQGDKEALTEFQTRMAGQPFDLSNPEALAEKWGTGRDAEVGQNSLLAMVPGAPRPAAAAPG